MSFDRSSVKSDQTDILMANAPSVHYKEISLDEISVKESYIVDQTTILEMMYEEQNSVFNDQFSSIIHFGVRCGACYM